MRLLSYIVILLSLVNTVIGQTTIDFNHYTTLRSDGPVPKDFTRSTASKTLEDLDNHDTGTHRYQDKVFYEGVNYAIDEMLHSGIVVYGDPISKYVTEVMNGLLRNEPHLQSELRVYTLKSNATNAFSTDQGIIFVTTGLVAQITNEAQLAYVLAHEISHFTQKHVRETFDWKVRNYKYADQIDKLSNLSKEKELEADRLALEMYHAAGYSKDGIFETFDVLMYSYLPFEEVEFPFIYFNTERMFIPEYLFPKKKYEIKAEEDYDDTNSSHPNIRKRKDSVEAVIGEFKDWGELKFTLSEERFRTIRNMARFESVRSDIIDAAYGDALYSVFLLERDFPSSVYLSRMKAQIWLNLTMFKQANKSNQTIDNLAELEGESAPVHFFLKKISKDGLITLALRQIYDLHRKYPADKEISAVYSKMLSTLSENDKFKLSNYSELTFDQAQAEFDRKSKDTISVSDTTTGDSKYDKIRSQKNSRTRSFDSTKFYLYAIGDLLKDTNFVQKYEAARKLAEAQKKREKELESLSRAERAEHFRLQKENQLKLGIDKLIVVEPKVFSSNGLTGFDPIRSEKIETTYSELIKEISGELGIDAEIIDKRSLESRGTSGYNERNVLISFLDQISQEDDINVFPVDFQSLTALREIYGTEKVMFTLVENYTSADINWFLVGASVVLLPTLPFTLTYYIPHQLFTRNKTEMSVLILDLEKGMIESGAGYYFNEPVFKHNLGAHIYDIFHHIGQSPSR
jgi:predicted Zn-dependent protease